MTMRRLHSWSVCLLVAGLVAAGAAAEAAPAMPIHDASPDSTGDFLPCLPAAGGSCYLYPRYAVVAWGSPGQGEPVAIVRKRGGTDPGGGADCRPDSLPGDFVVRNEWAEYFAGMWGDLVLIDSGTSNVRSLFLYDVPTRRRVFAVHGCGETAGWIDSTTVRVWVLCDGDFPRSLCPDIPDMFGVGVDSLYAFDLEELSLRALGPWRCNALQ